ncbi:hypothetical protein [Fundidesulfovibrio putealis]|uniref:hypothetical protein n=1 Tax=Fundidesulfovibrio putealis TaxID=270496 RepID=UPI000415F738|nr:hypothetical protein [Fundidesulfovibrio putealis]
MSNSPEDIIELTDIIEHGPGTDGKSGADGGVDLSFERELEDLFAESPTDKPAQGAQKSPGLPDLSDLPGLDDLHLPEENAKSGAGDDIDLDGLDALLAEAEKSGAEASGGASSGASGLGDLPELNDDFLSDAASTAAAGDSDSSDLSMFDTLAAPAVAAGAAAVVAASLGEPVSGPALDTLSTRLDSLEEKLQDMGDSLAALLAASRMEPQAPIDEAALAERVKQEVLSALPEPAAQPEPVDAEALTAQVEARVDEKLADLQAASESQAESQPDVAAMIAELKESLEQQNEDLKAELFALATPAQEPLDEAALAERVKQEVLSALPEPAAQPELVDAGALADQIAQIEARVDEKLADLQAASESQADPASMIAELKESLEQQNEALKSELSALATPAQEPLDEAALAERVKQEVLAALPTPEAAGAGAGEALVQVQELSGRVDAELSEVMARIEAIPAPADTDALARQLEDLAARQEQIQARLDALETKPAAPDLSGLVSREELAALRQSILDEMQKAVPAVAARIIREEIQALVREMD